MTMANESTRQRLARIASPIVEKEFKITELWAIVGDQRNTEWHLKIYREPVVQFDLPYEKSDGDIERFIREKLKAALR